MGSKKLSEKAKQLKREYQAEWRRKNPDKVRKHQNDYWERQAKRLAEENNTQ